MGNYTENRQNGMTDENPIFRSLAMIEERIREKLTIQNLADSVHFSKYHYQRIFREAVGDSVMGYVARRRISLAAMELAQTDASVLEIALKYGYDSHEGFTRSFRSHMGITPTEYRKYHLSTGTFKMQEEKSAMIYSKTTDEIIRELNSLIVQAKETAAYTRKRVETNTEATAFYFRFWNIMADKTESMADKLKQNLNRVTAIARQPDEISARFLILKAMEDTAFQSGIMAFQAGLTIARARAEHREAFLPVCSKYDSLAHNARISTDRIGEFMQELWTLIYQDMRKNAEQKIQQAVEKGMQAARELAADPVLPYAYIADEVRAIAEELSAMPLEEITAARLEDDLFRLDMIAFTADVDALRAPVHRPLFEGIEIFRREIGEAAEFFQGLPDGLIRTSADAVPVPSKAVQTSADAAYMPAKTILTHIEPGDKTRTGKRSISESATEKSYSELASWGNILLFYLKGEVQKLGDTYLNEEQKNTFAHICSKMNVAFRLMRQGTDSKIDNETDKEILQQVYHEMTVQAEELGIYGAAIQYLAEELKQFF